MTLRRANCPCKLLDFPNLCTSHSGFSKAFTLLDPSDPDHSALIVGKKLHMELGPLLVGTDTLNTVSCFEVDG